MLTEAHLRELLQPFQLELSAAQLRQIQLYLELLFRWNRKINLTSIRDPDECVTRHFGESLFLARHFGLQGRLLDIGSGAGFPGLALKVAFPGLSATLLEPVAKKRAFLKEVVRTCAMESVEVRSERLEEFAARSPVHDFDCATSRAVGHLEKLVPLAAGCLKPGGRLFLWLGRDQGASLPEITASVEWGERIPIPLSKRGEIWWGTKR